MAQKRDFTPIGAGTPPDAATNIINQNFQTQADINRTNIISDGTNDRVLIGYQKDGFGENDHGIKVSQAGVNVTEAEDDELIMSTGFNNFKIVSTGTISLDIDGSSTVYSEDSETIAHGLGYQPSIFAFIDTGTNLVALYGVSGIQPMPLLLTTLGTNKLDVILQAFCSVDATNVYFNMRGYFNTSVYPIRYYLVREIASA